MGIGRMFKQSLNENIDGSNFEDIVSALPLNQNEKEKMKKLIQIELNFAPEIKQTDDLKEIEGILIQNGFKKEIISKVSKEFVKKQGGGDNMLSTMISKCVQYENQEAHEIHLKNWREWNHLEVIEWIESLCGGNLKNKEFETFRQYLKRIKLNGKQLENINDLSLKLLTLNDEQDRSQLDWHIDKLTGRKKMTKYNEAPKEYLDPITFELMSDPVICKSGYTYDRKSIVNQIRTNGQDPFTRQRIFEQDLIPNRLIKDCIEKWTKFRFI